MIKLKTLTWVLALSVVLSSPVHADSSIIEHTESKSIETNFYIAKLKKFEFLPGKSLLVQAGPKEIYIGNRVDRLIYRVQLSNDRLEIMQRIELPPPSQPNHPDNYLLDIFFQKAHLYAAVGDGSYSPDNCGGILVYDFLVEANGDLKENPKLLFHSTPCVQGDTGGHVWTARLAGDGRNIYIAGGNWLVDWKYGTFPWSGFSNLSGMDKAPPTNFYGKITKINLGTKDQTILASGIRNLGGLYFDSSRKLLFNSDNGTRGGDKLNIVLKSSNFGWPKYSLGLPYTFEGSKGAEVNSLGNSSAPLLAWLPSISPSTISVATPTGHFSKYWASDIYVGSLKDKSLHRIRLSNKNSFIYDEPIKIGYRIRSHTTLADGRIILATDTGELLTLSEESQLVEGNFPKG